MQVLSSGTSKASQQPPLRSVLSLTATPVFPQRRSQHNPPRVLGARWGAARCAAAQRRAKVAAGWLSRSPRSRQELRPPLAASPSWPAGPGGLHKERGHTFNEPADSFWFKSRSENDYLLAPPQWLTTTTALCHLWRQLLLHGRSSGCGTGTGPLLCRHT